MEKDTHTVVPPWPPTERLNLSIWGVWWPEVGTSRRWVSSSQAGPDQLLLLLLLVGEELDWHKRKQNFM